MNSNLDRESIPSINITIANKEENELMNVLLDIESHYLKDVEGKEEGTTTAQASQGSTTIGMR